MAARWMARAGTVAATLAAVASVVKAGDWPFRHKADPVQPNSLTQIARSIDDVEDKIRDKGIIVLKHPDVWSQSRMSKYRIEFDEKIKGDADNFVETLQAVINRSDQASFESETALAAVLTPVRDANGRRTPITITNEALPATLSAATVNAFGAAGFGKPSTLGADGKPTPAELQSPGITGFPTPFGSFANTASAFREGLKVTDPNGRKLPGIGLDPTVVLDEHKRYLDHLNQIRRVNMGDDIADSAGYGLYLIRMPISIQPGEGTYKGHGAQLTVTARHEFGPNFMSETFETLVINDIVDQIGPVIYDLIRTGQTNYRVKLNEIAEVNENIKSNNFLIGESERKRTSFEIEIARLNGVANRANQALARAMQAESQRYRTSGMSGLNNGPETASNPESEAKASTRANQAIQKLINTPDLKEGQRIKLTDSDIETIVDKAQVDLAEKNRQAQRAEADVRNQEAQLAELKRNLDQLNANINDLKKKKDSLNSIKGLIDRAVQVPLLSSRVDNRTYPVSPSDIHNVFLTENLFLLAEDVSKALVTTTPRAADVRAYLRHELKVAYEVMTGRRGGVSMFADPTFISDVLGLAEARQYTDEHSVPEKSPFLPNPSNYKSLQSAYSWMIRTLPFRITLPEDMNGATPVPSKDRDSNLGPLGPLCWMIAVDAGYLNKELQADLRRQVDVPEVAVADAETIRFYLPAVVPPELEGEKCRAEDAFKAYVSNRWKIITFAVDPTVEQQNIGDTFSRIRELELAVAYSFAAGRINFQQLNRFRRQLQYEASTISLNKTVTSFAYGNETFGWRFSPRYQNPPEERSNLAAFANLAYRGGPGRNYQIDNSKLEAGQRELTAVVIMPSFLQKVRFDVESRWWQLHDPDEVKPHTAHSLEIGRRVIELRQSLATACDAGCYRPEDLNRLQVKVDQLEQMLPLQTEHITVPYGNALSGFDLFSPGSTALAPELVGFQGLDTFTPNTEADIFLLGKNFSLENTNVTVGGINVATTIRGQDGQPAPSPSFDILSREVIRVHVPAGSQVALLNEGETNPEGGNTAKPKTRQYIEVFVSTPNGISNPVRIPVKESPAAAARPDPAAQPIAAALPAAAEARYALADDQLAVNGALFRKGGNPTIDVRPLIGERLRIIPLDPTAATPKTINATFLFPVKTSLNVSVEVSKIEFDEVARCYVVRDEHLSKFAEELFRKLRDNQIIATDGSYTDTIRTRTVQVVIDDTRDRFGLQIVEDVAKLPTEKKNWIALALVKDTLHVRIFDENGVTIVSASEDLLSNRASLVKDLKDAIKAAKKLTEPNADETVKVRNAVKALFFRELPGDGKTSTSNQLAVNFRLYLEEAIPDEKPAAAQATPTTPAAATTTKAPATSALATRSPVSPPMTALASRPAASAPIPPLTRGVPAAPRRDPALQRTAALPPLPPDNLPPLPASAASAAKPSRTTIAKTAAPVAKPVAPPAKVTAAKPAAPAQATAPAPAAKTGLLPWSRKAK